MSRGTPVRLGRVQTRPPTRSPASSTATERPACINRRAALKPGIAGSPTPPAGLEACIAGSHNADVRLYRRVWHGWISFRCRQANMRAARMSRRSERGTYGAQAALDAVTADGEGGLG